MNEPRDNDWLFENDAAKKLQDKIVNDTVTPGPVIKYCTAFITGALLVSLALFLLALIVRGIFEILGPVL